MTFSFDQVPLAKVPPKRKRRKKAVSKPAPKPRTATKAGVLQLMAMIIDPIDDIHDISIAQELRRKKERALKAKECMIIYDVFLKPPKQTRVILRRRRKPIFRSF